MQKIVSALTSGDVPDVMTHDIADQTVVPQNAWNDKLVDLTDVVETQKSQYHPTAFSRPSTTTTSRRSAASTTRPTRRPCWPFHIWNSLVEKAGYKLSDAPKTWDAFWDFFKPMQKKLRDKGMRGVYALGLQPTTTGPADGNNMFHHFLIAYGGNGIVTPDGTAASRRSAGQGGGDQVAHLHHHGLQGGLRPARRAQLERRRRQQRVPRQANRSWIWTARSRTEVALYSKKEEYDDIVTMGLPLDNAGKPIPAVLGVGGAFVPKGAKNVEVAKDFLKYVIQPKVTNEYLKTGLGRWLPAMPDLVKNDPFWLDRDPHVAPYARAGLLGPTVPNYPVFNPGYAEANAQQTWGTAEADVIREGMTPQAAAEKALKRIGQILAKYPITVS